MDRYASLFRHLQDNQQGAFVPFVMLGDPDKATCINIIDTLISNGADALELGIPYSDPVADGPTIQKAGIRALNQGITPSDCFDIIAEVRERHPDIPIGLLLYSNLVLARGVERFYKDAAAAGVDSILIADVPLREADSFLAVAEETGIAQILIAPPNASDATLAAIGQKSSGYTYLLGRAGVTGAETAATIPTDDLIKRLSSHNVAPPLLGFGIAKPEQVKAAIAAGAAGAISGSATVNLIEQHLDDTTAMLQALGDFVSAMKHATLKD
ncbi:tryptophan synthase subunit alpha [Aestuariibacter halophilus]|uniref:Tryptophan synthase alpha chain n=1 Tax=Fluctibacter halophilus TaxID=226011 RepID=A0ABS8G434_9ALTE|nr:tryptophan synthase subunit alpha [Aestuariibacter halophilus]MCC2615259.1 tryptophan synthase subunit alpha [Aestuariibacter halophilus]